ncbi:hypothetical protein N9R34_01825 [Candidatus Thioglobus sp.]|nr:hypothetical protein [Candidatus Thioglobus sp.]
MQDSNKTIKINIKSEEHANLDSLSFRYGFYFKEDTQITLSECTAIKNIRDSDIKYAVRASFKLPNNEKKLQGKLILMKDSHILATIIREGGSFNKEELLSETLRKLRKDGDISPDDNVEMFHKGVNNTVDVVRHLSEKIGSQKIEIAMKDAQNKINNLSKALENVSNRAKKAEEENEYLTGVAINSELEKEEAYELAKSEKDRREKAEQKLEDFKANYSENQSVAYISNEEQPEESYDPDSEWNPGTFTLINAYSDIDTQRSYKNIVIRIELESENGERFTVKNNWIRGHKERIKLAKQLIGQQVIYSTWQSYKYSSKVWFKNITLANNQVTIDGEYFDLEEEITSLAKDVVHNLKHEDHTITEGINYGDDPIGRANSAYEARDYDLAIKLYLEINEPDSINAAADILFYQGNYEESIKYKHKSADLEFVGAFGGLAKAYREGWGVEIDYTKSLTWTLKGAEGGDVICMSLAGGGYAFGLFGFEKNTEKACYWLGYATCYGDESAGSMLNDFGYRVECLDNGQIQTYKI